MTIEAPQLTLSQQNELADAMLAYHLVDSPQSIDNPLDLPAPTVFPEAQRGVFIPPVEELKAWPGKLPNLDNVEEISRLTVYVLRLWREAREQKNHSRSETYYDGAEVARITRASKLGELDRTEVVEYSKKLNLAPGKNRSGKDSSSVGQIIAMAIARQYDKGKGGLTKDHKKVIGCVIKLQPQAAAYLDEQNAQASLPVENRRQPGRLR